MRALLTLALAILPAAAQIPNATLRNSSRPGTDFQIGDRFEIIITATPNQPVSVRTSRQGHTDWGLIIGTTDSLGRWSTSGQFEKKDFGSWREIWTVGGKLASPVIQFSVNAPCLPSGRQQAFFSGPNLVLNCETTEGPQTFASSSLSDPFRTQDQYYSELLEYLMANGMGSTPVALQSPRGALGDETADLISKLIGVNALNENEIRNTLAIVRAAFEKPETIEPTAKDPSRTLLLLRHLSNMIVSGPLKQEIDETIAYFQR